MDLSSKKKIRHFVEVRFFPSQDTKYLYNILSRQFLKMQLPLVDNLFRSLENQTNKNFEVVFIMNPAFFESKNYQFIFSHLKGATTLPVSFVLSGSLIPFITNAVYENDFVIQTRMDFDDFVYKDAVADTQSKVEECSKIMIYGYCKGYSYFDGEMLPYFHNYNGVGHHSIFQSVIMKSSFIKNLPLRTAYFGSHSKVKNRLSGYVSKYGYKFSEDMFQQNTSANAFIYFRHEFAHYILTKRLNKTVRTEMENALTSKDITKKQLKEEFGFTLELNSIK